MISLLALAGCPARSMSMAGKFHCRSCNGSLGRTIEAIAVARLGVFDVGLRTKLLGDDFGVGVEGTWRISKSA